MVPDPLPSSTQLVGRPSINVKIRPLNYAITLKDTSNSSSSSHSVKGYVKKDGTYVAPHQQTNPDGTKLNNWSTKGNVNPYTGVPGMKDPYK